MEKPSTRLQLAAVLLALDASLSLVKTQNA